MKRDKIKGFTFKVFGYFVELVFISFFLRVVAVSKPLNKVLWRLEV